MKTVLVPVKVAAPPPSAGVDREVLQVPSIPLRALTRMPP